MLKEGEKFSVEAMIAPDGTSPLFEFIASVAESNSGSDDVAVIIANLKKTELSELHREPLTKPLKGKLKGVYEVRFRISTGAARILYVYKPGKIIVIMGGVVKKANNFTQVQQKMILKLKAIAESKDVLHEKIDFTFFEN